MGITDLTQEDFAKLQELVKLLSVFGITENDLRYLPKALKIVENAQLPKKVELTEEEKKEMREKFDNALTPEKFMENFRGDIEEFNPNARN